jgi:hypothetical protein
MPYAMHMRWPGITSDQYDEILEKVRWEEEIPDGAIFHVAAFDDDEARVFDLWESPDQFQTFVESRLMPAIQSIGITTEPDVALLPVHRMFAVKTIESGAGVLV